MCQCQHFIGEREKGSLKRCVYWIPAFTSLSLSSLNPETSKWISDSHQPVTIDSHCYVSVLLPWASSAVLLSPPRRTLGCANLVRRHCRVCEHRLPIAFQLQDLVFTVSVISHDVYASKSVSNTETWMLDIENQLRDQFVFFSDFVYTPGWR